MNEELMKYQIEEHDKKINEHDEKIDKLEKRQAETNVRLDNLCKSLDNLTSTIKWFLGLTITTLLGFFMFVIQNIIK